MSDKHFMELLDSLDGVADRWTAAELRGMLVNSKVFEGTIIPAFYKDSGYNRTLKGTLEKQFLKHNKWEMFWYLQTLKNKKISWEKHVKLIGEK